MDLPTSNRIHSLTLSPLPDHANLAGRHAALPTAPLLLLPFRRCFYFHRVEAQPPSDFEPPSAAAIRLLDLRLRRRWGDAPPHSGSSVSPQQPVRCAPRRRVLGRGAARSV